MPDVEKTDRELLDAYARCANASAFETLVRRHVDLVYAVALRHCRDPHDAQDVAQEVFLTLARKARGLSSEVVLVGWLHRAAWYAAGNAAKRKRRRQHHEREAAMQQEEVRPPDDAETQQERLRLLDAALGRLRTSDRDAILLRYFRRASLREVGTALGISEEAAKKRVTRAVDELRRQLNPSGNVDQPSALSLLAAASVVPAAPVSVVSSVLTATAHIAPLGTLAFAEGLLVVANAKLTIAAAAAVLLLLAGGGIAVQQGLLAGAPAPAAAAPPIGSSSLPAVTPGAVSAVSPSGVRFELRGITEHNGVSRSAGKAWWSPSGAPLPRPLYADASGSANLADRTEFELAFHIDAQTADGQASHRMGESSTPLSVLVESTPQSEPGIFDREQRCLIMAVADLEPKVLRFEVAAGAWTRVGVASFDLTGKRIEEPEAPLILLKDLGEGKGVEASLGVEGGLDLRLIATDRNGVEHALTIRQRSEFALTADHPRLRSPDVASVRVEGRPFNEWVEFRNVALRPGANTAASGASGTN